MYIYPFSDILDRISITELKVERIGEETCIKEYNFLMKELEEYDFPEKFEYIKRLKEINGRIWDLEADIRACKEEELGLEEVGRRAIQIRKINKQRIAVKNEIVEKTKTGFLDIKMNHESE